MLFGRADELLLVVAESRSESAEGVGRADNDGVAEARCCRACVVDGVDGLALDGLDPDLVELMDEEFAVLGVHDGLYGCSEHFYSCSARALPFS